MVISLQNSKDMRPFHSKLTHCDANKVAFFDARLKHLQTGLWHIWSRIGECNGVEQVVFDQFLKEDFVVGEETMEERRGEERRGSRNILLLQSISINIKDWPMGAAHSSARMWIWRQRCFPRSFSIHQKLPIQSFSFKSSVSSSRCIKNAITGRVKYRSCCYHRPRANGAADASSEL